MTQMSAFTQEHRSSAMFLIMTVTISSTTKSIIHLSISLLNTGLRIIYQELPVQR
jgi:hypothetical protein